MQSFQETVFEHLKTQSFGRNFFYYESTPSTNTVAMEKAQEGAPEGSLFFATYQTAGKGRLGRKWEAEQGKNLMFSLILRPSFSVTHLGIIPIAASIAIVKTLHTFIPHQKIEIKWPNDILINGKKCCGMLLESELGKAMKVVLGIGINVNQIQFPSHLETATSLALESGRFFSRAILLARCINQLEQVYFVLEQERITSILHQYKSYLKGIGEAVTFSLTQEGKSLNGVLVGITEQGALMLDIGGTLQVFHAGEISFHQS